MPTALKLEITSLMTDFRMSIITFVISMNAISAELTTICRSRDCNLIDLNEVFIPEIMPQRSRKFLLERENCAITKSTTKETFLYNLLI